MEEKSAVQRFEGFCFNFDKDGQIIYADKAFAGLLGIPTDDIAKISVSQAVYPADLSDFLAARTEEAAFVSFRVVVASGDIKYLVALARLTEDGATSVHGIDVTGQLLPVASFDELGGLLDAEQRARKDALTGLLNNRAFRSSVTHFLNSPEADGTHAMFFLDIDNFKHYNDTCGHLYGDKLLVKVADAIRSVFRGTDIIGRIGGDEFTVFVKNVPEDIAELRANDLCRAVSEANDGNVTCSIGVAFYSEHGADFNSLLTAADKAMYTAKSAGRGTYRIFGK